MRKELSIAAIAIGFGTMMPIFLNKSRPRIAIDSDLAWVAKRQNFDYATILARAENGDRSAITSLMEFHKTLDTAAAIGSYEVFFALCDELGQEFVVSVIRELPLETVKSLREVNADPRDVEKYKLFFDAVGYDI